MNILVKNALHDVCLNFAFYIIKREFSRLRKDFYLLEIIGCDHQTSGMVNDLI
jgi:hypothetical protein